MRMVPDAPCLVSAVPLAIAGSVCAAPVAVTPYKNPECGCCEGYADYLRQHGFEVTSTPTNDLTEISRKAGIPADLPGCHTAFIGNYVVDGHVPVEAIEKLRAERPSIKGVTLPGMPTGSRYVWREDCTVHDLCDRPRRQ